MSVIKKDDVHQCFSPSSISVLSDRTLVENKGNEGNEGNKGNEGNGGNKGNEGNGISEGKKRTDSIKCVVLSVCDTVCV